MHESEELWDRLLGKSPETIYRCAREQIMYSPVPEHKKINVFVSIKEWFFPSKHAYPLPPSEISPRKYNL